MGGREVGEAIITMRKDDGWSSGRVGELSTRMYEWRSQLEMTGMIYPIHRSSCGESKRLPRETQCGELWKVDLPIGSEMVGAFLGRVFVG